METRLWPTDEDGDILTYTLDGATLPQFRSAIDRSHGPDHDESTDLDSEADDGDSYTVTVRATDPAGIPQASRSYASSYSDTIMVTITVTDVNEASEAVTGMAAVRIFLEVDGDR